MLPDTSYHKSSTCPKASNSNLQSSGSHSLIHEALSEYTLKHQNNTFPLIMFNSSTVSEMKKKVQDSLGTLNEIELKVRRTVLKDADLLQDYKISPEETISVSIHQPSKIQLFIKGPKLILIRAYKSCLISTLKSKLLKKTAWPDENFYLYFGGKILEDENTLSSYNIVNNSTIQYIERIQGGTIVIPSFTFNSLDNEVEKGFYKGLPLWRSLRRGFSLKGRCQNKNCPAYNDVIYINKGFGTFDMARTCFTSKCPQCLYVSKNLLNCCFWCASYEWSGCLKTGEKRTGKGTAGHEKYKSFKEGENVEWAYLEISVKPYK